MGPTRPVLRWHGGKWMLAPWITSHFPPHRVYVEPFGGAASVLLRKERSYAEVYNDLDSDVVNLFNVLRGPSADMLVEHLRLTPFSRDDFKLSYQPTDCPIERARRIIIRSFMGFGSNGVHKKTGFRANSNRSGTTPAHDWSNYPECLRSVIDRLRGVVIENRDAIEVMVAQDTEQTLHYVDPPYVLSTRTDQKADYAFEMDDDAHARLLDALHTLKGMIVLSGYDSDLYSAALAGWQRIEKKALADGAAPRLEVLWLNPACSDRVASLAQSEMFA